MSDVRPGGERERLDGARVLEVAGRALTIREQRFFEHAYVVALLVLIAGVLDYLVGPFEGQLRVAITVCGIGVASIVLALRWIRRRERLARLDGEGVTVWHPGIVPPRAVPWSLVVGYRDEDPEVVSLELARRVSFRRTLAVPTLTEPERVAVLAHLDAQGIQRLET